MTRPRVLRIITRLNVGGPARQALLLTDRLATRGFDPHLISGIEDAGEGSLDPSGLPHTRVKTLKRAVDPYADVRTAWSLVRLVRAGAPSIVHTHMAKAGALARVAARRARVPVVVHTFHGHVLEGYFSRPVTRSFETVERGLARWTDALVAVSARVRDELLDLGIGTQRQWHVIPVGLELGPLFTEVSSESARDRLGLPQGGVLVGAVGRLVPIKDLDTFLEAAVRVARTRSDVTFVVAGDGELRADLETRARRLLPGRVVFTGWVPDLPALYRALDVVVLTSRNEGTPTALIEAGAAGRPVVATRVGGVADVVDGGRTGRLVPAGDAEAVARAIEELISDPAQRAALGIAARSWVHERFTADRLVDDICDLYGELLARHAGRAGRAEFRTLP